MRAGDVAKVREGRGRPGMVLITRVIGQEAEFSYLDNPRETGRLYTAHLYRDAETMRETEKRRKERASKIGARR